MKDLIKVYKIEIICAVILITLVFGVLYKGITAHKDPELQKQWAKEWAEKQKRRHKALIETGFTNEEALMILSNDKGKE